MPLSLDANDKAILNELQKDASISNLELSKKIGLSASACLARTKNLKESGVIKQFTTLLDEKKLGMLTLAFVLVNIRPPNSATITQFLQDVVDYPQVLECYALTGSHDFLLKIVASDMASYKDFLLESLMKNPSISNVETCLVMSTEKRTTALPLGLI